MKKWLDNLGVLLIVGIILGLITYRLLVGQSYSNLQSSMGNVKFLVQVFDKDPSLSGAIQLPSQFAKLTAGEQPTLAWRILTAAYILEPDAELSDVDTELEEFLLHEIDGPDKVRQTTSLDLLLNLLQSRGSYDKNAESASREEVKRHVTAVLSGEEGALAAYDDYLLGSAFNANTYQPADSSVSMSTTAAVLNRLFYHYQTERAFIELPSSGGAGSVEPEESYRQFRELCQQMLISIFDDDAVSKAKERKDIIEGPEQMAMLCLFFIGILILVRKKLDQSTELKLNENHGKRLKSYYAWIASSLTAIGFIGTIRGLSEALAKADIIFRSGTGLEQSISISQITEVLGIAFATTLIALLLTLTLSFVKLLLDSLNRFELEEG